MDDEWKAAVRYSSFRIHHSFFIPHPFHRGHPFDYNSGIKAGGTPVRLRRAARLVV
jgi:hypothetical protein